MIQEVASRYDPDSLHGTLVCVHVANVPGYLAQQRYIPIYDLDLNRSFPDKEGSNTAERMANAIYRRFVEPCDLDTDYPALSTLADLGSVLATARRRVERAMANAA